MDHFSNTHLNEMTNEELGKLFPVIISDPDPEWSRMFREEKIRIRKALGKRNIVKVEHIGSTAVPGLKAKPTIDILLEIPVTADKENIVEKLAGLNYLFTSKPENPAPQMMCMKGYTLNGFVGQSYHIHVRYPGDWDELVFRDYLRAHPDAASEYEALKVRLAIRYKNDREGYTEGKTEFVRKIITMAREKNQEYETK
jgi:GrpB-like predicted nucleotidyltransferase (UPF0157 family)